MKRIKTITSQSINGFIDKIALRWRQGTQPNTPATLQAGETTESILGDLVAIPTVTGNREANHEGLQYIESLLRRHGLYIRRHEWNGVESLVATTRDTKTPTVFLMAHLDVVAAPPELFELKKKDGRYYGRGVLDMKGSLAAYLGAVQVLKDELSEYDFGIMITTDEEIGGFDGAQRLAEEGYLPKVLVLPDGGQNNWDMERFAKGIWWFTLEAEGKVAHGSRPWEGKNPVQAIIDAWSDIQKLFEHQGPETSTISLNVLHAGKSINQIPGKATASFDMRLSSFEEQSRIYNEVTKIADRHGLKVITEVEADPMINDVANEYLLAYKRCTEEVLGREINWVVSNAGNDGRFFASRGVACAVAYPLGAGHHGLEEWIAEESLAQMESLFVKFLRATAHRTQ